MSQLSFSNGQWINAGTSQAVVAAGMNGAIHKGAQVLSMSLGWRPSGNGELAPDCVATPLHDLCKAMSLLQERDVVLSAAVGNDFSSTVDFPASDSRAIAVGGIDSTQSFWSDCSSTTMFECGSNYSPEQIVAPAKQILSTFYRGLYYQGAGQSCPGFDTYGLCTGTSMAAPYIAGAAGILRSVNPLLSTANIKTLLRTYLDNLPGWDPQHGYGKPHVANATKAALGKSGGIQLPNRLTPLFSLYSSSVEDYYYTTAPQMASTALLDSGLYVPVGPVTPGYTQYPGASTTPKASVYIFTGDRAPFTGASLVPLYRLSIKRTNAYGNSNHRDTNYATQLSEIDAFHDQGYEVDGIEGYIFGRCTPEPSCMPAGTVRLYRWYHPSRDDFAIFPEPETAEGYTTTGNEVLGYVYPNADSDGDTLIDGFERLTGTNIALADSDCDGASDGTEILNYPYGDPLSTPGCLPKNAQCISQSVPTTMTAGQSYPVIVTLKNAGTLTWSPIGPQCNAYRWGSLNSHWAPTRAELPSPVAPGQQITLNYSVTAPTTTGTYPFQWRMVHECVEWFGETCPTVPVNVVPPAPVANFSFTCAGLSCSFNGTGSTGTGITYSWSFGGSTSSANHDFGATGAYTVTLTVSDPWGQQSSKSRKVSVSSEVPATVSYFTVPQCRLVDTRTTNTPLSSGQIATFNVTGSCNIPATANVKAVSVNFTVIAPTGPGYLVFYPGNQTSGPFVNSAINFSPSASPRANNLVLRLATDGTGKLAVLPTVFASPGQVHLVLDVEGYFSEDTAPAPGIDAQGPLGYQSITPCRVADTRTTNTPIPAGGTASFTVQGQCGIPAGASAAALNLTVFTPTAGGYATAFPAGPTRPPVSSINFVTGTPSLANGVRNRLAATTPDLSVFYLSSAGATTHVILDAFGYFGTGALLKYRPIIPCRTFDSRYVDQGAPTLAAGETRNIQIQGNCGVPVGAKAALANLTVIAPASSGYLTAFASGTTRPLSSALNFHANQGTTANGVIAPLSTNADDLSIYAAFGSVNVVVDVFGYFQ
jgi:hypothetical protein